MHLTSLRVLAAIAAGAAGCTTAPAPTELHEIAESAESAESAELGGLPAGAAAAFQDHLDTLHAAGITGVIGEIGAGRHRFAARSGTARAGSARPVPWNARFRIGSNTKTFVAVVVLQLVGEGRLSLDDTVERWLPGVVSGHGHDGSQITIRQLLQHTSGIRDYTEILLAGYTADAYLEHRFDHHDPGDLVAIAMGHAPEFAPGTSWSYSNTNYILAGMVIQEVTGRDWTKEVRARILEPLALHDTFDPADRPGVPGPHANAYELFAEGEPLVDVTLQNHTWADAAGSLISTTADLARFWRALQQGRLLRPAQMAQMRDTVLAVTFQDFWPGARYGLGIMQAPTSCGEPYWSHWGDTLGYSTRNAISDDGKRTVVVSLSTQLDTEAGIAVLFEGMQLLDDAICAGR